MWASLLTLKYVLDGVLRRKQLQWKQDPTAHKIQVAAATVQWR